MLSRAIAAFLIVLDSNALTVAAGPDKIVEFGTDGCILGSRPDG
jgi:hypothetical protein